MCKTTIPAPGGQVPCPYADIMGAGDMAVPALRSLDKFPDRILPDLRECTGLYNVFYPGDKDPCCPAVFANHLCPVWNGGNDLVCYLPAMIAVGPVPRIYEVVVHGSYYRVRVL